jgi:hypothetical protein
MVLTFFIWCRSCGSIMPLLELLDDNPIGRCYACRSKDVVLVYRPEGGSSDDEVMFEV